MEVICTCNWNYTVICDLAQVSTKSCTPDIPGGKGVSGNCCQQSLAHTEMLAGPGHCKLDDIESDFTIEVFNICTCSCHSHVHIGMLSQED